MIALNIDYAELARALLREGLADAIARVLATRPEHPEYADKEHNPYGTERAFSDAARRGEFPTFRRNRRITARWEDVARAIENKKGAKQPRTPEVDGGVAGTPGAGEPDMISRLVLESVPGALARGKHAA